ncbi:AraC family transcriptional regulator [Amphibacillus sediminis]|uniref:AraC family transcriptional regulator n=1 Tax=Amphibacillus sediminis TaxID=360185 RepID=UPI00082E8750|nr:AraC family transcriptional regulator [Amphibacillus sediminis]
MPSIYQQLLELTDEEQRICKQAQQQINKEVYTDQKEFVVQSSKFLTENKLIVIRKHPRFIAFPAHRHDYIELNYVYHGCLKQKVGQESFCLKKGELLFLNQHVEHALESCGQDDLIINFIIEPRFFDHMFQNFDVDEAELSIINFMISSLFNQNHSEHYMYFKVADIEEIQTILAKMIAEMMHPSALSEVTVQFYMGLLMVELMKHTDKAVTRTNDSYDYHIVLEVLKYIDDHYSEAKLEDIAARLNLTGYNLSKHIKKRTGKTFKTIVQERRLETAKTLLVHSNYPIDHIATEIGYQNISYFYRLFKEKYHCTPKDYRDNSLNANKN